MDNRIDIEKMRRAIRDRHSVRTFRTDPVPREALDAVSAVLREVRSPFSDARYVAGLIPVANDKDGRSMAMVSTYGVVKNAQYYIVVATGGRPVDEMAAAYVVQQAALAAVACGLGTVWLGGTFKVGNIGRLMHLSQDDRVSAVVALGLPAEKKRLSDKILCAFERSDKRKPIGKLFFTPGTDGALEPISEDSPWREALEGVRVAPSSLNSQPWRAVVSERGMDFYYMAGNRMRNLDIGIALAHFAVMIDGDVHWGQAPLCPDHAIPGATYVISAVTDGVAPSRCR